MKRLLFFKIILIFFVIFPYGELLAKPLICTPRAHNLVEKMPTLFTAQEQKQYKNRYKGGDWNYEQFIPEGVYSLDWPTVRHLHPAWSTRMNNYLKALGRWAGPTFWQVPLPELQACMITKKVGKVDPNHEYDDYYFDPQSYVGEYAGLMGDHNLRLLNQIDISLEPRNSAPFNSIAFYRTKKGTQIILIFDGAFTRSDPAAAYFNRIKSPLPLVLFSFCSSAGGGFCDYRFYTKDPSKHRLIEYPLFQKGSLKFSTIGFSMTHNEAEISAPQISKNGKLVPKINSKDSNYRLKGLYYVSLTLSKLIKPFKDCREDLKEKFNPVEKDPWSKIEACKTLHENFVRCPIYNDLSLLFYQSKKREEAKYNAIQALQYCKGNQREFKAAEYNYRQAMGK